MGFSLPSCKWPEQSQINTIFDYPMNSDIDTMSIEEFDGLIPPEILNKMTSNHSIVSKKNSADFKTIKLNNNLKDKEMYYRGEFNEKGQKEGIGKMIIKNKNNEKMFYYGIWEEDKLNLGKIYYINGDEYDGQIKNYLRDGKGTFISDNENYDGQWLKDEKDGYGILKYKNGIEYKGYFKKDKFNGKGEMSFPNGIYYSGGFFNDLFHGMGCLKGNNNHIYNGNFKNGFYHGLGEFKWIDDTSVEIYNGNYSNGKKDGKGELKLKNDDKFVGNWESGKPHGEGCYETKNRKYFANWRGGLFMQLTGAEIKEDGEESVNLNFITPEEDINYQNSLINSLYSNSSINSQFIKGSIENI